MSDLHVWTTGSGRGRMIVHVQGELDIATAARLHEALDGIEPAGSPVALDLHALEFIDSTGLRLVVELDASVSKAGGSLEIVMPPPHVFRIFELTKLDGILNFVSELPEETGR